MNNVLTAYRDQFWSAFYAAEPTRAVRLRKINSSTRWLIVGTQPFVVSHFISEGRVGVFIRGERGVKIETIQSLLNPHEARLVEQIGSRIRRADDHELFNSSVSIDASSNTDWPRAFTWLAVQAARYEAALVSISKI